MIAGMSGKGGEEKGPGGGGAKSKLMQWQGRVLEEKVGRRNRPVGLMASWAQAVQTKGHILPLTSLCKVPSSFLAAKQCASVLAATPGPIRSPVPPDVLSRPRMSKSMVDGNSLLVHRDTWTKNEVTFFTWQLIGSIRPV